MPLNETLSDQYCFGEDCFFDEKLIVFWKWWFFPVHNNSLLKDGTPRKWKYFCFCLLIQAHGIRNLYWECVFMLQNYMHLHSNRVVPENFLLHISWRLCGCMEGMVAHFLLLHSPFSPLCVHLSSPLHFSSSKCQITLLFYGLTIKCKTHLNKAIKTFAVSICLFSIDLLFNVLFLGKCSSLT